MTGDRPAHGRDASSASRRIAAIWPGWAVTAGVVAVVAGPLALGVRAWRGGWVPKMSDLRQATLATQAAGHLEQLTGPWSRIGLPHPGPLWTYWCVPFLAAADTHPKGLVAAAVALVVAALAVLVLVVARSAGRTAGVVAAAVALAGTAQMSLAGLGYPWNATIVIVPVAAGLVCATDAVRRGSVASAAAGTVLGALAAQSHLGALPVGALVVAVCVGGAVAHRPSARALAGLGLVVALPWLPLAADQLVGDGTPAAVARYAVTGDVDPVYPPVEGAVTSDLSAGGALRRLALVGSLAERGSAAWGGAEVARGLETGPTRRADVVMAGLVVAALAGAGLRRRPVLSQERRAGARLLAQNRSWRPDPGHAFRIVLLRVGLAALAVEALAVLQVRDELRLYVLAAAQGIGLVLWIGVALFAVDLVRTRVPADLRPRLARRGPQVAAVALLLAAPLVPRSMPHGTYVAPIDDPAVDALLAAVPDGTFLIDLRPPQPAPFTLDLAIALEARGRRVAVRGGYTAFFSDRQRRATYAGTPVAVLRPEDVPGRDCDPVGVYLEQLTLCVGTAQPRR